MIQFGVFVSLLMVIAVSGQVIHDRECRTDVEVVQNFDVDKYVGKWYEISRYDVYFQRDSDCCWAEYTKNEDGTITVENTSVKLPNTTRSGAKGLAVLTDPSADPLQGKLNVVFNSLTPGTRSNYWILGTDYENYSVIWYCKDMVKRSAELAWVLSRTPTLNSEVQSAVDEIIDKYLERDRLRVTVQDNDQCGYE